MRFNMRGVAVPYFCIWSCWTSVASCNVEAVPRQQGLRCCEGYGIGPQGPGGATGLPGEEADQGQDIARRKVRLSRR
jgi:hypothetical protein